MEGFEGVRRAQQFERLFTALLLLLVALLLLLSIVYTTQLWWVKVSIAVVLASVSSFFGRKYLQER
jgi:hypothetical protein